MTTLDGQSGALCAQTDPELWFPNGGQADRGRAAVRVCRSCPLIEPCLDYALRNAVMGVWGGTNEKQRRRIRDQRGITVTPIRWEYAA